MQPLFMPIALKALIVINQNCHSASSFHQVRPHINANFAVQFAHGCVQKLIDPR
jgi:hypothetical protein